MALDVEFANRVVEVVGVLISAAPVVRLLGAKYTVIGKAVLKIAPDVIGFVKVLVESMQGKPPVPPPGRDPAPSTPGGAS